MGAQRKQGAPTGPTLLLKTVLERGTGFMFAAPTANSIFLQNYTGQQAKASFAMRKAPKGRWFVSQMEVFHVVNKVMPTHADNRGCFSFAIHAHLTCHYAQGWMRSNKIHRDRFE